MRRLRAAALLTLGLVPCCSLLVDHDVERVRCSESGRIGPPVCDVGEICAEARCQACIAHEICGDAIDNDCNEHVDDCGSRGAPPMDMAVGAGGVEATDSFEPREN